MCVCNYCCRSLGLENNDCTQNMKYKAEDAASRATDTMKSAASGTFFAITDLIYTHSCTTQFFVREFPKYVWNVAKVK